MNSKALRFKFNFAPVETPCSVSPFSLLLSLCTTSPSRCGKNCCITIETKQIETWNNIKFVKYLYLSVKSGAKFLNQLCPGPVARLDQTLCSRRGRCSMAQYFCCNSACQWSGSLLSEAAPNSIWSMVSDCEIYPFLCLHYIWFTLIYKSNIFNYIWKICMILRNAIFSNSLNLTNILFVVPFDSGDEKMSKVLFSIVLPSIKVSQMSFSPGIFRHCQSGAMQTSESHFSTKLGLNNQSCKG